VISKGASQTVIEATRGVRTAEGLHWLTAIGLVDGDGRAHEEIAKLAEQGVLVLPSPTVENLFFIEEAQRCFVEADIQMRGGCTWEERQHELNGAVQKALVTELDNVVARRTLWRAQREISSHPLSVKDVRNDRASLISVDVRSLKQLIATEISEYSGNSDRLTNQEHGLTGNRGARPRSGLVQGLLRGRATSDGY
jgi:hypothetical protein